MNEILTGLPLLFGGAAPAANGAPADGGMTNIFMIGAMALVFVVFYFMIIRPQNKKQKEAQKMLKALKKGDKVQTIGGLRGVVHSLKDDSIILKVDDTTKMEFVRSAIASVVEVSPVTEVAAEDEAEKK